MADYDDNIEKARLYLQKVLNAAIPLLGDLEQAVEYLKKSKHPKAPYYKNKAEYAGSKIVYNVEKIKHLVDTM